MYLEITKDELEQTLSALSRPDRLAWFKAQPSALQQDIALLIRTESIAAASARIKAIENCQAMLLMKPKSIEKEKQKARIKAAKAKEKEKEKARIKATKAKEKARTRKDSTEIVRPTIVGMIVRIGTEERPRVGLSIETEFGSLIVNPPRFSSVKYLTLFVKDGEIVDKALSAAESGVKAAINTRSYTYPGAIAHVYDLVIKYNHEQTLSA